MFCLVVSDTRIDDRQLDRLLSDEQLPGSPLRLGKEVFQRGQLFRQSLQLW